jgi:hypothetical protein
MSEWISVEDGYPSDSNNVMNIVALGQYGHPVICSFWEDEDGDCFIDQMNMPIHGVTDWLQLPEPPK